MLYQDPESHIPTFYRLDTEYSFFNDNRIYKPIGIQSIEGRWAITKGIKNDPDAVVFQLNPDKPQLSISFLRVDDQILHLLNNDRSPLAEHDGQKYVLSRSV